MKFGTEIHIPLRIDCLHFGDPLTYLLVISSGESLGLSNTFDQIPTKLMAFPSAIAVLEV